MLHIRDMMKYLCVCFLLVSLPYQEAAKDKFPGPPVILVPGNGGSQLEAKLNKDYVVHYICRKTTNDFFNVWLSKELLMPLAIDCLVDNMKLVYNRETRRTSFPKGVNIRVPGFGHTLTVENIDPSMSSYGVYMSSIVATLVSMGYVRNSSIRAAPYDFRKAANEHEHFFDSLKALVEETYAMNGKRSVVLLAHSMGCVMSLHFLRLQSKRWKRKFIRALIGLGGVWGGTVKVLKTYTIGDDLGSYFLRGTVLREQEITCPSLAWFMPSKNIWKKTEVLVETDIWNYTVEDYEKYFYDIEYPTGWEMRKDIEKVAHNFDPPGVELHCINGYAVDTIEKITYQPGDFPKGCPTFKYGDGDGSVNVRSLNACADWKSKQSQPVYHESFYKSQHSQMLHDKEILEYLKRLISQL